MTGLNYCRNGLCVPKAAAGQLLSFALASMCVFATPSLATANANTQQVNAETSLSTSVETSSARSLFSASGLQELIEKIPSSTASSFEDALTIENLPDIFADVEEAGVKTAVRDAFKYETFDKYIIKQLHNGMDSEQRKQMLAWYETELGALVRRAEIKQSLLTEQKRFEQYQVFLKRYPPPAKREQLIAQLDETMHSTQSAVDMMVNIQVAFNLSLSRFLPEERRFTRQEIRDMVSQDEREFRDHYTQQTQEVLLFTYQDLTDDELEKVTQKLSTDAGQAFVMAINDGIKKAMFAASLDLGDGLGALLDVSTHGPGI